MSWPVEPILDFPRRNINLHVDSEFFPNRRRCASRNAAISCALFSRELDSPFVQGERA
jgi:hypothetical protein